MVGEELEKNQQRAYSYGNYASFLMCNGRYAEAVEFWEKAISISPYPQALVKLEEAKRKLQ